MVRWLSLLLLLLGCEPPIPEWKPPAPPPTTPPPPEELLAARSYTVRVPAGFDASREAPLLIAFHGYGGSGAELVDYFRLDVLADQRGLLLIAPDGLRDARGNHAWNVGPTRHPEWDPSWVTAVLRDVKQRFRVDARRVFAFGHSQGAHMAHRMGCDDSEDVTALASVAGQVSKKPAECAPTRPVSVVQIHGTDDQVIGYFGDLQSMPPDPDIPSAHDTVAVWARNDGCTGPLERSPSSPIDLSRLADGPETEVDLYAGCPAGIDVALWSMIDIPHRPMPNADFSTKVFLFLEGHPRP